MRKAKGIKPLIGAAKPAVGESRAAQDNPGLPVEEQRRLTENAMRRQLALSLRVGLVFFVLIFGLPLFNYLLPQAANARVGGFTLTWLFLGVLFYPLTWLLSGYFIRESDNLEAKIVAEHRTAGSEPPALAKGEG